jgi:hypothetical protein
MTDEPDEPTPAAAPKPADEPTPIQPEGWTAPRGYSNGTLAPAGSRLLAIAGQIAWDADQHQV